MLTHTHTFAILELPPSVHALIKEKLIAAGYDHAIDAEGTIDMHGIGIAPDGGSDDPLKDMEVRKDAAYLERNRLVAALASCFPAGVARTAIDGWNPEWHGCVYIDLPTGQASWHFHDSHAHLFGHLPKYHKPWDGHTTEEKYQRLEDFSASRRITVWQMDDCEWWVGAGPADALAAAMRDFYGYTEDDKIEPTELTDADLDRLKFTDCDENERPTGTIRTFREQLAIELEAGGSFPRMFASTEY